MRKLTNLFITLSFLNLACFLNSAYADIEWSGVYRFEGNFIKNPELGSRGKELSYGLQHLVLRPKIQAGDGLTIYGQFNIFNDETDYPNSQMGQIWGSGVRSAAEDRTATASSVNSNSLSQTQKAETIKVSQLYLTLSQEYGQLLVGRAPLHFGLGMTHNAGRGLFDHWYDSRDMVAYKFILGSMWVMPMFGKPAEGSLHESDDVSDYMIQMQYENPETDLELGVFYQMRRGGDQASDAPSPAGTDPAGSVLGGAGATNTGSIDMKQVSLYALRDSANLRLGVEATFQSGESGVVTTGGDNVAWGGFGIAGELDYRPEASAWKWSLKAGTASGDDPATDAKFEGFIFDRNYDVAMLMFNHPLGQNDFFRSRLLTGDVRDTDGNINKADVEAISNVVYISPNAKYVFNDRWSLDNRLTTGYLGNQPLVNKSVDKNLGYEWDVALSFSPRKGVTWVNQAGFLFPGGAWKGEDQYDSSFAFGFTTKAAISF
jgi:hypothetical protein